MENPVVPMAMVPTLFSDHSQDPAVPSRPMPQAGPACNVVWFPAFSAEPSQLWWGVTQSTVSTVSSWKERL